MNLKTRPVLLATAALVLLAAAAIIWQIAKSPSTMPSKTVTIGVGSASGLVTPAQLLPSAPLQAREAGKMAAASEASPSGVAGTGSAATAIVRHRIVPLKSAQPPILPNEANTEAAKVLGGKKSLLRLFYLDPLARRFVASVDGLGNKPAPNELWLLKPAPGEIVIASSGKQPTTQLIKRANSQRYTRFVQWVTRTDNAELLALYRRMYPLLQQTYLDLGHPNG